MSIQAQQGQSSHTSLRAKLVNLSVSVPNCALGKIANELDEDTREALCDAMCSSASSNSLANSLREAGYLISRSTIVQKRHCFTSEGTNRCDCFPGKYSAGE